MRPGRLLRIEELAEGSGATVRNIRVYQERGLLPPPVRRGRTALYGPEHQQRLKLILRLLDRGYTFATIDELLIAERHGLTLSELIESDGMSADRRPVGPRRRASRSDAVAQFDWPVELVHMATIIGLVGDPDTDGHFFSDPYMYELFREIVELGVDGDGMEEIGRVFLEGMCRAAEAFDLAVNALRETGMDQASAENRIRTLIPRASAAARLVFQSAAQTVLPERDGTGRA